MFDDSFTSALPILLMPTPVVTSNFKRDCVQDIRYRRVPVIQVITRKVRL